jgi:M6 family metalloprotease-like protein
MKNGFFEKYLKFVKRTTLVFGSGFIYFLSLQSLAAPMDGYESTFKQPDGTVITLKFFGDEFYARAETTDGYTVIFDPSTKSYDYANVSSDGKKLVKTGMKVGKGNPSALGLAKRLDIATEESRAIAKARFEEWDKVTGNSKRWKNIKDQMAAYEAASTTDVVTSTTNEGPSFAPPTFTTTGTKIGLTLLIDFSDDPATIPQANVIDYLNGTNYTSDGNNGSVMKYFQDNSGGLLTYTNVVTVYIRMAKLKSYYNDTAKDCGTQGRLLINDALAIMQNLTNYNSEILPSFNDITVDAYSSAVAFNVFYAGGNGGVRPMGLWPHSWSLASYVALGNGKSVANYQITNLGTSLSLGTFCHENGHMLCGFPDIYDYGLDSKGGAGGFCLMDWGGSGVNPVLICAYLRRAAGWCTTTDFNSATNFTASLSTTNFNKIYRYPNPAAPADEYFLFENRQKAGRDANIAASGIAIWHVDQQGKRDIQSRVRNSIHANYECTLIQADNLWHFNNNVNTGDNNDLYYLGNSAIGYTNAFNDTTGPDANWWSGANSGLKAFDFSASATTMTFQLGLPTNTTGFVVTPTNQLSVSGFYGGPFTPASQAYVLTNSGGTSLNWTAGKSATWINFSTNSGTLAAGASTTVTVSIVSSANTLVAGLYNDTVVFTNTTNGSSNVTRGVALTINHLPALVTLGSLSQTYNGNSRVVTTTTAPTGLVVNVTYAGNATAPTNAGSYAVVATIADTIYQGATNGTLFVTQATPTVTNWPTAMTLEIGQALSNAVLGVGSTSVPGAFSYLSPTNIPSVGVYTAAVTFVANDSLNYTNVTGSVIITVVNIYAVPFYEPFDARTLGDLNGKYGWIATGTVVQATNTFDGSAKAAHIADAGGFLKHTFNDGRTKVWTDMRLRVVYSPEKPTPETNCTVAVYVSTNAIVWAFNGTNAVSTGCTAQTNEWTRFTTFSDYTTKTYILYVNDVRVNKFGFYNTNVLNFSEFKVGGEATFVDNIGITPNQPAMRWMPSLILLQ